MYPPLASASVAGQLTYQHIQNVHLQIASKIHCCICKIAWLLGKMPPNPIRGSAPGSHWELCQWGNNGLCGLHQTPAIFHQQLLYPPLLKNNSSSCQMILLMPPTASAEFIKLHNERLNMAMGQSLIKQSQTIFLDETAVKFPWLVCSIDPQTWMTRRSLSPFQLPQPVVILIVVTTFLQLLALSLHLSLLWLSPSLTLLTVFQLPKSVTVIICHCMIT